MIGKIGKRGKKLNRYSYPTNYNFLIVRDIWKVSYQILLIVLLKEFIKLNANMEMIIKNAKLAELDTKIAIAILNIKKRTLKIV